MTASLTREERIRCLTSEKLQQAIDGVLDLRHSGTDPKWTDPELIVLRAEQRRRDR